MLNRAQQLQLAAPITEMELSSSKVYCMLFKCFGPKYLRFLRRLFKQWRLHVKDFYRSIILKFQDRL
ncbi:hypothetical protein H5410_016261 [Solanum commersonii]|uniref:Uncharacterized protein n=1 Tax=Solanum commersonii TaxID=4109 RepID=A0A9J5ZVR6_SOLCO|nr:hypothetical protein H5410_016261 [Solanum commersonii]